MKEPKGHNRKQHLRQEYAARINRVIDYIEANIERELALETLARVANFSPYHFHRIFRAIMGEPIYRFIQRIRLERAASQLITDSRKPITAIAFDCGFSGSAAFARAFREQFGMSASQWRACGGRPESKDCKTDSKIGKQKSKGGKDLAHLLRYTDTIITHSKRRNTMINTQSLKVTVKEMPEMQVAYIRHIGPYQGDSALFENLFGRLCAWAGARDLFREPGVRMLAVYHDNPDITEPEKLRVSVCVTVPKGTRVDGEVGLMTVPGGKYAVAHFQLKKSEEYMEAWDALYGQWLPESGYQPDDRPPYELYEVQMDRPAGEGHQVDICLPVKPF
jgi:AraC family transcriptional regulator